MGDPLLGIVLDGRYRVDAQLGAGGMGTVYRAHQLRVGRDVAVKVLARELSSDETVTRRFENEASIISKLRHPNTLKLIDFGEMNGRLFIVTELLEGRPLNELLAEAGPLAPDRTLRIMLQICDSLVEAHGEGVVHRDLKPANVFVEQVGGREVVRVLDFGIAKLSQQASLTVSGQVFGTPAYMSPEQAVGVEVDARSDLYSLGCIGFECLAGKKPFVSNTPVGMLYKQVHEDAPDLATLASERPDLERLISRLLEKDPSRRPQSAAELRTTLEAMLHRTGGHTAPTVAHEPPSSSRTDAEPPQPDPAFESAPSIPAPALFSTDLGLRADTTLHPARHKLTIALTAAVVFTGLALAGAISWVAFDDTDVVAQPPSAERPSTERPSAERLESPRAPQRVAPAKPAPASTVAEAPANVVEASAVVPAAEKAARPKKARRAKRRRRARPKAERSKAVRPKAEPRATLARTAEPTPVKATPARATPVRKQYGQLEVIVATTGGRRLPARVRVDGQSRSGATPLRVRVEAGRTHVVEVESPGYPPRKKKVRVGVDQTKRVPVIVDMEL